MHIVATVFLWLFFLKRVVFPAAGSAAGSVLVVHGHGQVFRCSSHPGHSRLVHVGFFKASLAFREEIYTALHAVLSPLFRELLRRVVNIFLQVQSIFFVLICFMGLHVQGSRFRVRCRRCSAADRRQPRQEVSKQRQRTQSDRNSFSRFEAFRTLIPGHLLVLFRYTCSLHTCVSFALRPTRYLAHHPQQDVWRSISRRVLLHTKSPEHVGDRARV